MKHIPITSPPTVTSFPLAIIVSQYNKVITEELKRGTLDRLNKRGIVSSDIFLIEVPGAIEIPFIAQQIALSKQIEVIIALGVVIRGETDHYHRVCEQVSQGCQRVTLDYQIPLVFGVLTTENEVQAWDRLGGHEGHKGIEFADCAITMHHILKDIKNLFIE